MAIADRRIRAKDWSPADMAAANALFWTGNEWDGSQSMLVNSLPFLTKLPEETYVKFFSVEMLKTIVTTMQGAQAMVLVIGGLMGTVPWNSRFAIDSVFAPLAAIGLLRLFSSFWLSEQYAYSWNPYGVVHETGVTEVELQSSDPANISLLGVTDMSLNRYRRVSCWGSRLFRVIYLLTVLGLWAVAGLWTFFLNLSTRHYTVTSFTVGTFYFLFLTATFLICAYYAIREQTDSTVLPCVNENWYKVYTAVISLSMMAIVVIAALETFKATCGTYTSLPASNASDIICV